MLSRNENDTDTERGDIRDMYDREKGRAMRKSDGIANDETKKKKHFILWCDMVFVRTYRRRKYKCYTPHIL